MQELVIVADFQELELVLVFVEVILIISVKSERYCRKRGKSDVREDSHLISVLNFERKFLIRVRGSGVFRINLSVIFL